MSTAEPFLLPGGKVGCLLIHGFTGTPKEMRWWGEDLAGRGYTVLAPRLAGHATTPK
ncbi:MAG: carboxylesterase, partial [Anaerolineaceae bacterium]|nr:carboxylesterase [Anaerolineaceae bacterium]